MSDSDWNEDDWEDSEECLCGNTSCQLHVFPSRVRVIGADDAAVTEFRKNDPMLLSEAQQWFLRRIRGAKVSVTPQTVRLQKVRTWADAAVVPAGHQLPMCTYEGDERKDLARIFSGDHPNGTALFSITENDGKYTVAQQCPCGLSTCEQHIFPSQVPIRHTCALKLKLRGEAERDLEKEFRRQPAMTPEQVVAWFMSFPIKWKVDIVAAGVRIRMVCHCKQAFLQVPCGDCSKKFITACSGCEETVRKRSLDAKGLCQDCHHKQRIDCAHCKRNVTRGHYDCTAVLNQHYTDKPTHNYPPIIREKGAKVGICPDCGDGVAYNVYHRHQNRKHYDVKPCMRFNRNYRERKCMYCDYKHCDVNNVTQHQKRHIGLRQHPCRHNCGQTFTRASAEISHVKEVHSGEGVGLEHMLKTTRRGGRIRRLEKTKRRRTMNYVTLGASHITSSPALAL